MHIFLKTKIKSLTQESRIIRNAERHTLSKSRALLGKYNKRHKKGEPHPAEPNYVTRAKKWIKEHTTEGVFNDEAQKAIDTAYAKYWGLHDHRVGVLRKQARSTYLAYGFLRGRSYSEIESEGCYQLPDFKEVERLAEKFCQEDIRLIRQRWAEWHEDAIKALTGDKEEEKAAV